MNEDRGIICIVEFPGYGVSADGRIWSSIRMSRGPGGRLRSDFGGEWRPLRSHVKERDGYAYVHIKRRDGRRVLMLVHRLVLFGFVGAPPAKCEACHWNGVRTDNRIENLRWATRAENSADSIRHGTRPFGNGHVSSKLTAEDVREIRLRRDRGERAKLLAEEFRISLPTIYAVCNRTSWKRGAPDREMQVQA